MVSLSNNDRFDNDKIFSDNNNDNIWHFFIITGLITFLFFFFCIYLKDT